MTHLIWHLKTWYWFFPYFHIFQDGYIFPEACSCRIEMQPDDIMHILVIFYILIDYCCTLFIVLFIFFKKIFYTNDHFVCSSACLLFMEDKNLESHVKLYNDILCKKIRLTQPGTFVKTCGKTICVTTMYGVGTSEFWGTKNAHGKRK